MYAPVYVSDKFYSVKVVYKVSKYQYTLIYVNLENNS